MKFRLLISILLSILCFSSHSGYTQVAKPPNWNDIVSRPWYQGTVAGKPAFIYLDPSDQANGYFFVAYNAVPNIYQLAIKWKKTSPRSVTFRIQDKKVKMKFKGTVDDNSIEGMVRTSGRNARMLNISKEIPLEMAIEKPVVIPKLTHRYNAQIFKWVNKESDISYGAASGYYVSMPVEANAGYDYQQIILDAMKKMYVNPTKEAILNILNRDPVSLALTDLQGLRFDLYQPAGDPLTNRPLIVMMHGGAFIMGDKAAGTITDLAENFARKGYVVAAINYRMGFNPASKSSLERSAYRAVQDARAALRFLSYNADKYKIDPNCIFLAGSSAGAITSLNTAFMEEEERPESTKGSFWQFQKDLGGLDESTNTFQNTYKIKAVANLWGAVHDTSVIDRKENIPVLNFHGDADKIVPCGHDYPFTDLDTNITSNIVSKMYGSRCIHERLISEGIHSELVIFPRAGHEPQSEAGNYNMVMDTISLHTTDFFLRALFNFPAITGASKLSANNSLPSYSVAAQKDVDCFWQVEGGKIIPGTATNQARIVWLSDKGGNVSVQLINKNQADLKIDIPVVLPDNLLNYYPIFKK